MKTNLYSVWTERIKTEPVLRGQVNVVEGKRKGETVVERVEGVTWERFSAFEKHHWNARCVHAVPGERKIVIYLE